MENPEEYSNEEEYIKDINNKLYKGSEVVSDKKELSNPKSPTSRNLKKFDTRAFIDTSVEEEDMSKTDTGERSALRTSHASKEDEAKEETSAETTKEEDLSHGELSKKNQGRVNEEDAATRHDSSKNQTDETRQVYEGTKKATSKRHATVQTKTTPVRRSLRLRRMLKVKETDASEDTGGREKNLIEF